MRYRAHIVLAVAALVIGTFTALTVIQIRAAGNATDLSAQVDRRVSDIQAERRHNRAQNLATHIHSCIQIERLKQAVRDEATENYANLDKNLRLLKLARTPVLVQAARKSLERKLRRFAPISGGCHELPVAYAAAAR